ncbi:MAG: BON domain-containing protein [Candidatus Eisenbacteria bacterium]|nr:BON domain-containing protein [Candidatus Latescibacterota bacterium]MBD3301701.1 BON domain-containing protein [Candidatus Eisenbacteria bacterium]
MDRGRRTDAGGGLRRKPPGARAGREQSGSAGAGPRRSRRAHLARLGASGRRLRLGESPGHRLRLGGRNARAVSSAERMDLGGDRCRRRIRLAPAGAGGGRGPSRRDRAPARIRSRVDAPRFVRRRRDPPPLPSPSLGPAPIRPLTTTPGSGVVGTFTEGGLGANPTPLLEKIRSSNRKGGSFMRSIQSMDQEGTKRGCWALVALSVALALLLPGPSSAQEITDEAITDAVENEIWIDEVLDPNAIDIVTMNGIVTLDGTVQTLLEKDRVERIVETTRGVRAVVDRIEVEPVERPDPELEAAVRNALLADPATEAYEVTVSVTDGAVTLNGTVESWAERSLAETVAKEIRGIRRIENEIDVQFETDRGDYEIEQEIEKRLKNDVRVDDYLIDVEVDAGTVRLTGTVGSLGEKQRAKTDAWVAGVTLVDAENLEVAWFAREKLRRQESYVERSDDEIKDAVQDALLYDPRVLSFNPEVTVANGTVTLAGTVDNLAARMAAEEDARNVVGVRRVRNYLKVRPDQITLDETLKGQVVDALRQDPYLERWQIDVRVEGGWVYLDGLVENSFERRKAEEVVQKVPGVVSVVNNIDFEHEWTMKSDWEISQNVTEHLFWSPYVDEDQVDVSVTDGVVTLSGTVDTWGERTAAVNNAWEGGAKDVRNRLDVDYHSYGPYYDYWLEWP